MTHQYAYACNAYKMAQQCYALKSVPVKHHLRSRLNSVGAVLTDKCPYHFLGYCLETSPVRRPISVTTMILICMLMHALTGEGIQIW